MKKVLIAFLLVLAALISFSIFNTVENEPAEGTVSSTITVEEPTDEPPIEDPEPRPDNSETVEVEVEEEEVPVFKPLAFNGKLNAFAKKHKGKKVKIEGQVLTIVTKLGVKNAKSKGVIVNGNLYFGTTDGGLYVINNGMLIKLN